MCKKRRRRRAGCGNVSNQWHKLHTSGWRGWTGSSFIICDQQEGIYNELFPLQPSPIPLAIAARPVKVLTIVLLLQVGIMVTLHQHPILVHLVVGQQSVGRLVERRVLQ